MNQRAELNLSENSVLADAISEFFASRSWNPLSTLLLSFAHFATWSWALVAISCVLFSHVDVLSSCWRAINSEWKSRRYREQKKSWRTELPTQEMSREKRTRRNRQKKVKRRLKEKAKKAGGGGNGEEGDVAIGGQDASLVEEDDGSSISD